jgi:hypothetical protein
MVEYYRKHKTIKNDHRLVFPTSSGRWQSPDNWRARGFYFVCERAGWALLAPPPARLTEPA